jgi:hypothetical protein
MTEQPSMFDLFGSVASDEEKSAHNRTTAANNVNATFEAAQIVLRDLVGIVETGDTARLALTVLQYIELCHSAVTLQVDYLMQYGALPVRAKVAYTGDSDDNESPETE